MCCALCVNCLLVGVGCVLLVGCRDIISLQCFAFVCVFFLIVECCLCFGVVACCLLCVDCCLLCWCLFVVVCLFV